ncbi:MAG: hypothetical protein [Olavius algarvensis Gamma 1 endosymbiont]|nr:MAG: hypothetical protein [Olavius algarvensis Gamma 1 endosymbiont]
MGRFSSRYSVRRAENLSDLRVHSERLRFRGGFFARSRRIANLTPAHKIWKH